MASPRYSIVIPTRDRARTLEHTLRTCLDLEYDDFEVVVCDNCGSPATRQVVEKAGSDRIVYLRSDAPLSMSDNWEKAVAAARGEYVTVLGDDDGVLPFALKELDLLFAARPVRAVQWIRGVYSWPCCAIATEANRLALPYPRSAEFQDGHCRIRHVVEFKEAFDMLPMIYNAAIRRDLLEEARSRGGRLFPSITPDVYSGFAFAYLEPKYLQLTFPLTLAGVSGASNGVAVHGLHRKSEVAADFSRLNAACGHRLHPWIPDLSGVENAVADSFLAAKARIFPHDDKLRADRRLVVRKILESIPVDQRAIDRPLLRATLTDDPKLLAWFDALPDPPPPAVWGTRTPSFGADGLCFHIQADRFGIATIHDAVRFATDLLNPFSKPIRYDLPGPAPAPRPTRFARLGGKIDRFLGKVGLSGRKAG